MFHILFFSWLFLHCSNTLAESLMGGVSHQKAHDVSLCHDWLALLHHLTKAAPPDLCIVKVIYNPLPVELYADIM